MLIDVIIDAPDGVNTIRVTLGAVLGPAVDVFWLVDARVCAYGEEIDAFTLGIDPVWLVHTALS